MSNPTCRTCRWYNDGYCHKNAPVTLKTQRAESRWVSGAPNGTPNATIIAEDIITRWPYVYDNQWCGEHALTDEARAEAILFS